MSVTIPLYGHTKWFTETLRGKHMLYIDVTLVYLN